MTHQIAGDLAKALAQLISLWADTEQNARCSLPASLPRKRRSIINTHCVHWNSEWKKKKKNYLTTVERFNLVAQHYGHFLPTHWHSTISLRTYSPYFSTLWPTFRQIFWIFSYNVLHYIHVLHIYKFRFHWNALELHANLQANIGGLLVPDPEIRPLPCSAHPVTHLFHGRPVGT